MWFLMFCGWVVGQVTIVSPEEISINIPADGISRKTLYFEVQVDKRYPIGFVDTATAKITSGLIINTDTDPESTGTQIPIKETKLAVTIQAPDSVTRAILEIEVENTYAQIPVRFTTPAEPFILVGSLNASLGNYSTSNKAHPDLDAYDNMVYAKGKNLFYGGRKAFYAKGRVWDKYRLTASFDSDRYYQNQLFKDLDPDYQYPIYGDASTLVYDAQTESMFYAKLERNASFVVLGDYHTYLQATEFTTYDRSFNGLLTNFQIRNNHNLVGFATVTDREMTLDEIRGEGISGYYRLSRENITRFSEKVKIEIRDRYHPETVIKSSNMVRYLNYDIDYIDGTLMFKQPISSIDASGNPIFIVISYEHKSERKESAIGGFRYSGMFKNKYQFGSTFILEEQSPQNYLMYGIDTKIPIAKILAVKGEWAGSRDLVTNQNEDNGHAYKAELTFTPRTNVYLNGYYRKVENNFVNRSQSGRQFELGSEKYGVNGKLTSSRFGRITSEYYRQFNNTGTPQEIWINSFLMMYEKEIMEKGQVRLGYQESERERKRSLYKDFNYRKSELLRGQLAYQFLPNLSGVLESDVNLRREKQTKPNSTAIGVTYDLSKRLSTYLKYRFITGEKNRT